MTEFAILDNTVVNDVLENMKTDKRTLQGRIKVRLTVCPTSMIPRMNAFVVVVIVF